MLAKRNEHQPLLKPKGSILMLINLLMLTKFFFDSVSFFFDAYASQLWLWGTLSQHSRNGTATAQQQTHISLIQGYLSAALRLSGAMTHRTVTLPVSGSSLTSQSLRSALETDTGRGAAHHRGNGRRPFFMKLPRPSRLFSERHLFSECRAREPRRRPAVASTA